MEFLAERLGLEAPHPSSAGHVRGARTIPREFVVALMSSAEQRPNLRVIGQFDSAGARGALESADTCRLVAERVVLFLANLNYTAEALWARVAANAMRTFAEASIWAEDENQPELAAEIEHLRKKLGRRGAAKRKKKKNG